MNLRKPSALLALSVFLCLPRPAKAPSLLALMCPGKSLSFNGTNAAVVVPGFATNLPTSEITLEFWQNASLVQTQATLATSPYTASNVLSVAVPYADGKVYWDFGNATNGGELSFTPSGPVTGAWRHFAFVASAGGNFMQIYTNGVLAAQKTGMTPFVNANLDLRLGGLTNAAYAGLLDEVRIWNVARTQSQIQSNMSRMLPAPLVGLVAYWRLDEGGGTNASDSSGNGYTGRLTSTNNPAWTNATAPFVPCAATGVATPVTATTVILNGLVAPNNSPTAAWFEWGTNTSYGNFTPATNLGAGSALITVTNALGGLVANTIYHYRMDATNSSGTNYGADVIVNNPPVIDPIPSQYVVSSNTLSLTATASDVETPTNLLTFSLLNPPAGAVITTNGSFSWTPTDAQLGSNTITVQVTDNGSPPLTVSTNFTVFVYPAQTFVHDDAAAYNAAGNVWTNGMNLGSGFGPWVLRNANAPGGYSGFFIGHGGAIATVSNSAFGLYANGAPSDAAVAYRGFTNSIPVGSAFKIKWQTYGVGYSSVSLAGFTLRQGNFNATIGDFNTAQLFSFFYSGGGPDSFSILDGNGSWFTGLPFGSAPFQIEFILRSPTTYTLIVKDAAGQNVLTNFADRPLIQGGTIDSFSLYAFQTDGDQVFNDFTVAAVSFLPPNILNVIPANGAIFVGAPISFTVQSFAPVLTNSITLLLNGVAQSNLVFSGSATNRSVSFGGLSSNLTYNASIIAVDVNGSSTTNQFTFKTLSSANPFIEAEDYNFAAGSYIAGTTPNNGYYSLLGSNFIDYLEYDLSGANPFNGYRQGDLPQVELASDVDHANLAASAFLDYDLGYVQNGEWENYTRILPTNVFGVYARMSGFGANPVMLLDRLAAPTATTTNQPRASLGSFVCPFTGAPQSYTFVPLTDLFGNPVTVQFPGTNTFRCTCIGSDSSYNFNYLMLLPGANTNTLRPYLSAGFPYPNATGVLPDQLISFTIANRQTALVPASVQLFLNATNVTSSTILTTNAAGGLVGYQYPTLFAAGSTNTLQVIFADTASVSQTNQWQFVVANQPNTPPRIRNILPTNNAVYASGSGVQVSFDVTSDFSYVSTNHISLTLNGVAHTNLSFSGTPTAWHVTDNSPLADGTVYFGTITAQADSAATVTARVSFSTLGAANSTIGYIEGEDYNFGSGLFFANSFPVPYGGYGNLLGSNGIDYLEYDLTGFNPPSAYRPTDLPQVEYAADFDHANFAANFYPDYDLGYIQNGEWENYTRVLPNTNYAVYARMSGFGANPAMLLDRLAAPTATTTNQPRASLGTFLCPITGAPQSYTFVPLTDLFGNPVSVQFPGTNTFRCTCIGSDGSYNLNYLMLVPVTNTATLRPYLSTASPAPNATGVEPDATISFTIANRQTAVNPASIQVLLNGTNVSGALILSTNAAGTAVSYPSNPILPPGTNILQVAFSDGTVSQTNQWQFAVINLPIIPPAYALSPALAGGSGFAVQIAKASDDSPSTDFPSTIARALSQLAGSLTNSMTSQPYTNQAAGPAGNGAYAETNTLNYDITGGATGSATFVAKAPFPYIPPNTVNNYIALAASMYVQLSPGVYGFAVRSDDGFELTTGPTPANTNLVLGIFDAGRANDTPTAFEFIVQTNGLYPMRLIYDQTLFGGSLEFYSISRTNGTPFLINDPATPSSIKSFSYYLQTPVVTTLPATGIGTNIATLDGSVIPYGPATTIWFDWGPTTNYNASTTPTNVGTGPFALAVSNVLTNLNPGATYHFRLVATNGLGRVNGADAQFTTTVPTPPLLTILQSTTNVVLRWPSPSTGFGLEQNGNLATTNWIPVGQMPSDNGTNKSLTIPFGPTNNFFRLRKS